MEESLIKILNTINTTLTIGLKKSPFDNILQIVMTIFSVVVGAFLGTWLTNRSDKKKLNIENHKKFFEDFNGFYIKIHSLYQEIYSYNQLINRLGFPLLMYDFSKSHYENVPMFLQAEKEYENFSKNNSGNVPNKEQYWDIVHQTCIKLKDFNLIINLASSMNSNAQVSSMFVSRKIKKEFDSLILKTQEISKSNFATFNLYGYRLQVITLLQLIKNEIDPYKTPIFFEHPDLVVKKEDTVKLTLFANSFTVIKTKENKIICKNAKGKRFKFDKTDIEKL